MRAVNGYEGSVRFELLKNQSIRETIKFSWCVYGCFLLLNLIIFYLFLPYFLGVHFPVWVGLFIESIGLWCLVSTLFKNTHRKFAVYEVYVIEKDEGDSDSPCRVKDMDSDWQHVSYDLFKQLEIGHSYLIFGDSKSLLYLY